MRLECRGIAFRYPQAERDTLNHISFAMTEPGFNALFGPSGVGKTSLARILSGHLAAGRGEVHTTGIRRVLYTYNLERLPGWSTVAHHLERITPPERRDRCDELVAVCGVRPCLDKRFSQLSLGQRNRVNLIRYLLQDFDLLIMDESLANVDERTRGTILLEVKAMFPDALFLYISHNVVEVARFCRQIVILRSGDKDPQAAMVRGQDARRGQAPDRRRLDATMLEIMNAA